MPTITPHLPSVASQPQQPLRFTHSCALASKRSHSCVALSFLVAPHLAADRLAQGGWQVRLCEDSRVFLTFILRVSTFGADNHVPFPPPRALRRLHGGLLGPHGCLAGRPLAGLHDGQEGGAEDRRLLG